MGTVNGDAKDKISLSLGRNLPSNVSRGLPETASFKILWLRIGTGSLMRRNTSAFTALLVVASGLLSLLARYSQSMPASLKSGRATRRPSMSSLTMALSLGIGID